MGEILEGSNFNYHEVEAKLFSMEAKLDKDFGSSEFIKKELGDIKELINQSFKVMITNIFQPSLKMIEL